MELRNQLLKKEREIAQIEERFRKDRSGSVLDELTSETYRALLVRSIILKSDIENIKSELIPIQRMQEGNLAKLSKAKNDYQEALKLYQADVNVFNEKKKPPMLTDDELERVVRLAK